MAFKEIDIKELNENFIKDISKEWMLISAGNENGYNMMTASWGFVGEMWGNDEVAVVVRPTRYTMKFIDENDYFTVSFYGDNKAVHKVCGHKSGRDTDKTKEAGLTPVFADNSVYFKEARLVIVCKKEYSAPLLKENFINKQILDKWYDNDLHNIIFGRIEKAYIKE